MTLLSTKIYKEVNKVLAENTLLNTPFQHKLARKLTHDIIQLTRNAVSVPCLKNPELVEPFRKVLR